MIKRILGAAIAVIFLLCTAVAAQADSITTTDGQIWPKKNQRGRSQLTLSYDKVTLAGRTFNAAEVDDVYVSAAYANTSFRKGELSGTSRYWAEAAASFGAAAEDLKGAAREIALFHRMTCLAETNDATKTFEAAKLLLDAFPRSFYFARVQDTRARILINRGDSKGAGKALDEVVNAPGMNARDHFAARLARVYLFKFKIAGNDKAKYAAARAEYDRIVREIESRNATNVAGIQWLTGKVGIGRCHVYEGNFAKARPYFDQVISDKKSTKLKSLLAQAYTGRGDVKYATINKELAGGKVGDDERARISEALTDAALDYVRVARFYIEYAGDDLYPATVGAARVWATHFHVTGEKDCELAKRAGKYFVAAYRMLPVGEPQRLLKSEVMRFRAKRDEACTVPSATGPRASR